MFHKIMLVPGDISLAGPPPAPLSVEKVVVVVGPWPPLPLALAGPWGSAWSLPVCT